MFILVLAGIIGLGSYFLSTEAPFTKGEILYDVPYNNDQRLDVYFPTKNTLIERPVLLFIHGGAWIGGTKEAINLNRFNGAIKQIRDAGYVVISPSYTLAEFGKSPFPKNISDCYESITWIKKHAKEYHLDTNRIGLFGESAGAHIAMMLSFASPEIYGKTLKKPTFEYLINVYGPNDLNRIYQSGLLDSIHSNLSLLPEKIQNRLDLTKYLIGFNPETDSVKATDMMRTYSPINHLNKEFQSPTLIIQGNKDRLVPIDQSINLKTCLDTFQVVSEIHVLLGVDHAFLNVTSEQKDSVQNWIVNFVIGTKTKN